MQNSRNEFGIRLYTEKVNSFVVKAILVVCSICVLLFPVSSAKSHFLLNLNVRIVHVEHVNNGLKLYLRTPMPYLVADRLGAVGPDGLPTPAPFTTNREEDGKLVHYVDWNALKQDPEGLGKIAGDGINLDFDGRALKPAVGKVRVYPIGEQPKFATLSEAKASFSNASYDRRVNEQVYVGDAVVDVELNYQTTKTVRKYSISMNFNPGLPRQDDTANLIIDHASGGTKIFRARGLLADPITISRSVWAAVTTFLWEGIRHILEGFDHVLFVICLLLGASSFRSLAWRITGFTLGHSVTLTAGFFGYVPSGDWFIPTVETGIALSIVYAAAVAVYSQSNSDRTEHTLFFITMAIGLLHGLGFSFVLLEILQVNSPDIWQSLAAFNVGVELGQLLIIVAIWPLFRLIKSFNRKLWIISSRGIAAGCAALALFWAGERALSLLATFTSS